MQYQRAVSKALLDRVPDDQAATVITVSWFHDDFSNLTSIIYHHGGIKL